MSKEIKESINEIQGIVDFYELDDENNYDYSDKVLISMRNLLDYIANLQQKVEQLENIRKEAIEFLIKREKDNQRCSVCSVMTDILLKILDKEVDNND